MALAERAILVHGTGATAASDEGPAWWQRSGALWRRFADAGLEVEAFIWPGENTELGRRRAGRALARRVSAAASAGEHLHLVGHSHGGSVISHALGHLKDDHRSAVLTWTTVGTPYLHYGARIPRLVGDLFIVAGACALLLGAFISLRGADVRQAWEHDPAWTALWFGLLAIPALLALWAMAGLLPFLRQALRRPPLRQLAAERERHLSLWSRQDEPIIGLGASGSFSLRVLGGGKRGGNVVATLANQLVNNLVSRALQGSNIAHLEMRSAAPAAAAELAHRPLPQFVDDLLIQRANQCAGALGLRVRDILSSGADPVTGFSDLQLAATEAFTFDELVHTTYFQSTECVDLIVHHVLAHSSSPRKPALDEPLRAWYEDRFEASPPAAVALPGNRLGLVVAAGVVGVGVLIGVTAISLRVIHERTLAPTTADYQLQRLISSRRLAAALSSVVPGEALENVGGDLAVASMERKPGQPITAFTGEPPDLSVLRPYVHAIVRSDQVDRLVDAAVGLESAELRTLFYAYAMPAALEVASKDQITRLASSRLFPGPAVPDHANALGGTPDYHYPAVNLFIRSVTRRQLLDRPLFEANVGTCPAASLCADRAKLFALREIAAVQGPGGLDFLLPLPSPYREVQVKLPPRGVVWKTRVPLATKSPLNGEDAALIEWLAAQQALEHLTFNGVDRSADPPLSWAQLGKVLGPQIGQAKDETANHLLRFIVDAPWADALPATVLEQLPGLVDRQVPLASGRINPDMPFITGEAVERFVKAETARTQCAGLDGLAEEEFEDRMEQLGESGIRCRVQARKMHAVLMRAATVKRAARVMQAAQKAEELFGENGFLDRFANVNLRAADAKLAQAAPALLFGALAKGLCQEIDGPAGFSAGSTDRKELARALRQLDTAADAPGLAAEWLQRVFSGKPCAGWDAASDDDRSTVANRAREMSFEVADWLDARQPDAALAAMRALARTADGPVRQASFEGFSVNELASWFERRGHVVDVLYATSAESSRFRIMRRAALYGVAACEQAWGFTERAGKVVELASRSGVRSRHFARPSDALSAIEKEAEFYGWKQDWRRAGAACEQCSAIEAVKVTTGLIALMSAARQSQDVARPANCEDFTDEGFKVFLDSQTEIEDAARRADEQAARKQAGGGG